MWGSSSPKSSLEWIWRIWSGRWRMIIFPTFATIAGRRNSKVCLTGRQIILIINHLLCHYQFWEKNYKHIYFIKCFLLFLAEEGMLYRARYFGDTDLYQRAQRARTPSCAKLSEISASLHGWGCLLKSKCMYLFLNTYEKIYLHFSLISKNKVSFFCFFFLSPGVQKHHKRILAVNRWALTIWRWLNKQYKQTSTDLHGNMGNWNWPHT